MSIPIIQTSVQGYQGGTEKCGGATHGITGLSSQRPHPLLLVFPLLVIPPELRGL